MTNNDIDAIRNDLDEVRANVSHAEAQHNPHALTALAAGDALLAKVDELTAELNATRTSRDEEAALATQFREQLTAANRRADGLEADLRSAVTANTEYANQDARVRQQRDQLIAKVEEIGTALDQTDAKNVQAGSLNAQYHGYGARLLYAAGKTRRAEPACRACDKPGYHPETCPTVPADDQGDPEGHANGSDPDCDDCATAIREAATR